MFLLLSAISSSIDSFIIGVNLKLAKTQLKKKDFLIIFFLTYVLLFTYHFIFSLFHINFISKWINVIIYIILGIIVLLPHEKKEVHSFKKVLSKISIKEIILLVLSHSTDSFVVSLTFLNDYTYPFLCFLFAGMGIFLTWLGYKIAKEFPNSEFISAILYFFLAVKWVI